MELKGKYVEYESNWTQAYQCKLFILINLKSFQFGGEQFAVTCAQVMPILCQLISDPKSREPENVNPTENAISAVTKILKYNTSGLQNVNEIIEVW